MFWEKKSKTEKKSDFWLLENSTLCYVDSSCATLKPKCVLDAIQEYYTKYPVCHSRSNYALATTLQKKLDNARKTIADFIGAKSESEILFTKNTTESINLVAYSYPFQKGDGVIISDKEHNSNLIPWLALQKEKKIILHIIPTNTEGFLDMNALEDVLKTQQNCKLISVTHVSNIDGLCNPITEIVSLAKKYNVHILVDGAQAVSHKPVSMQRLGVDFYAFSGHKTYGPTGIGVLYVKKNVQKILRQFITGGNTVITSTTTSYTPAKMPMAFEAGLQHYSGILGLGEACSYLQKKQMQRIEKQETALQVYLSQLLQPLVENKKIAVIGPTKAQMRGSIYNFIPLEKDAHEVSLLLDKTYAIAVRSGHHCVHSWYTKQQQKASVRISIGLYTTKKDIEYCAKAITDILE